MALLIQPRWKETFEAMLYEWRQRGEARAGTPSIYERNSPQIKENFLSIYFFKCGKRDEKLLFVIYSLGFHQIPFSPATTGYRASFPTQCQTLFFFPTPLSPFPIISPHFLDSTLTCHLFPFFLLCPMNPPESPKQAEPFTLLHYGENMCRNSEFFRRA